MDTVAVGKFAVNLTSLTNESISIFKNRILLLMLKNLLPFTHDIPLTVELLNAGPLAPKKDYKSNRLVSGPLQLDDGSHLTIDETQLKAGSLDSTGISNARVLKSLLEYQKVVEDDLARARKTDRSLGTQDLSRLLTMGRLVCVSFGETSLPMEHWQMVKELERLQRERLHD